MIIAWTYYLTKERALLTNSVLLLQFLIKLGKSVIPSELPVRALADCPPAPPPDRRFRLDFSGQFERYEPALAVFENPFPADDS
jgi:hypothetical protein